jgi:hypothetical protein
VFDETLVADPIVDAPAVIAQSRRAEEPKDSAAFLQVDLRKDVYRSHVDDSVVE